MILIVNLIKHSKDAFDVNCFAFRTKEKEKQKKIQSNVKRWALKD